MSEASRTAFFPAALRLFGQQVIVVGGGEEFADKHARLIRAGAHVTVISSRVPREVAALASKRELSWYCRELADEDVARAHIVFLSEKNEPQAARLRKLARANRFWLCAVDQPAYSDFVLMSVHESGPVQLAVSTSGTAPLLARRLRLALADLFDARFGAFAERVGSLRSQLLHLPIDERKKRLTEALEGFAVGGKVSYPSWEVQKDRPKGRE